MRRLLVLALLGASLTGCGTIGQTSAAVLPLGGGFSAEGLAAGMAARADVEGQAPLAFALTAQGQPVVAAMDAVVRPMRAALAKAILADGPLMDGFNRWDNLGASGQLALLKQAVAHESRVMGFQVPPIVEQSGASATAGEMAFYQPSNHGVGKVTLFPDEIAKGGKWLALATVVHEMRHAAQYQLLQAAQAKKLASGTPAYTLAISYGANYQALDRLGGEDKLSYGDYAHLTSEYDAFQTGNYVASVVSHGQADTSNFGFVDAQYDASGRPQLDLVGLARQVGVTNLIAAVNRAESSAVPGKGGSKTKRAPKRRAHRARAKADVAGIAADLPTTL